MPPYRQEKVMEKGLISIVIPAYNSAAYLEKCVDSVASQAYGNFEILIVDDGSTDNTKEAAASLIRRDSRVRYLYQENAGASAARNHGIHSAKGEYLTFLDADDWIDSGFLARAVQLLEKNRLDFVLGGTAYVSSGEEKNPTKTEKKHEFRVYEAEGIKQYERKVLSNGVVGDAVLDGTFTSGPVCKLFRTEIIRDLRFDTSLILGEDVVFNLATAARCKKIGVTTETWYYYRQNDASVTKRYNPGAMKNTQAFMTALYNIYRNDAEMLPYLKVRAVKQLYGGLLLGECSKASPLSPKEQRQAVKQCLTAGTIAEIIAAKDTAPLPSSKYDKVFYTLAKKSCRGFYTALMLYRFLKR